MFLTSLILVLVLWAAYCLFMYFGCRPMWGSMVNSWRTFPKFFALGVAWTVGFTLLFCCLGLFTTVLLGVNLLILGVMIIRRVIDGPDEDLEAACVGANDIYASLAAGDE